MIMTLNRSFNKNEKGARKAPLQMWLVANEAMTAKGGPYIYYYKPSSDLKLIALEEVSEFTSESWLRSARSAVIFLLRLYP